MLVPLALAQFICSFAGSNMNVMINDISEDLDTTVQGVQTAITIFLLVMAALMIPAGKLTDIWGRKRCFTAGLALYGIGALMSAISPGLGVLILGNSILEGVGTALLIPPVYILTTMLFTDVTSRARAFGIISGMGGLGAAAGPLIGGLITTAISWRAAFVFQALIVATILLLSRQIEDPAAAGSVPSIRHRWARSCRRVGLVLVVMGILAADDNAGSCSSCSPPAPSSWRVLPPRPQPGACGQGAAAVDRALPEPHARTSVSSHRTSSGCCSSGISFVVSAFLQVVRGYNAIQTGVIFTARDRRHPDVVAPRRAAREAVRAAHAHHRRVHHHTAGHRRPARHGHRLAEPLGVRARPPPDRARVGTMLTPSVNVVQSSFPEELQGEISGLSRSVSNLGSCLGTAIAGTILVADLVDRNYAAAMIMLGVLGLVGLAAAWFLPANPVPRAARRHRLTQPLT